MKTGKSLQEMAVELERQAKSKRDFIAPTTQLEVLEGDVHNGTDPKAQMRQGQLRINGQGAFDIGAIGHEQIQGYTKIPRDYYDRMLTQAPGLLARNVNTWFRREPNKRMVRTLDGRVRAFPTDKYRPLDNIDLANVGFETLTKMGVRVESSELTERRMYIKAVTDRLTLEVKKGDVVQAGIVISNSEVACGSVKVEPLVFRLVCMNGAIANDHALRKYHVGRGHGGGDSAEEFFKDETRRADDRAFWLKVRDVIEGSFKKDVFERIVARMRETTEREINGSIEGAVEVVSDRFGLKEGERNGVLKWLVKGGDLTQWGLLNAITRTSQEVDDYDRATDMERFGGEVLELPKQDWELIANAEKN